jgi:hypothetical protein
MSIDPVAAAQLRIAAEKTTSAPGAAPGTPFEEILARGAASGAPVSVGTAAEILRLKMLGAAVGLGGDDNPSSQLSLGVQGLLDRFLAQLPSTLLSAGVPGRPKNAVVGNGGEEVTEEVTATDPDSDDGSVAVGAADVGHLPLEAIVAKASKRYGVDGGLIKAVIKAESNFNPRAVSPAGARGLMQLMPATARGLGVTDSFDPEQNVMAGTRFLKDMLSRYGGNVDDALAAYNWGPGNVDRHGCESLPRETRAYLSKVKEYYAKFIV